MTTQLMQKIGFIYASIVLTILMVTHVPVLLNQTAPLQISFVQAFLMIFPMWGLMIFYLNKTHVVTLNEEEIKALSLVERLKIIMGNPPQWLFVLTCLFYAYGLYSLFLWMTGGIMDPELVNGQYQSNNHGQMSYYSQEEYLKMHRTNMLATTGFFLMFASFSFAVFFPKKEKTESFMP